MISFMYGRIVFIPLSPTLLSQLFCSSCMRQGCCITYERPSELPVPLTWTLSFRAAASFPMPSLRFIGSCNTFSMYSCQDDGQLHCSGMRMGGTPTAAAATCSRWYPSVASSTCA